jgi:hypothetical protein
MDESQGRENGSRYLCEVDAVALQKRLQLRNLFALWFELRLPVLLAVVQLLLPAPDLLEDGLLPVVDLVCQLTLLQVDGGMECGGKSK